MSALHWRHYASAEPLGQLLVEVSYNTRSHVVKPTKTERPRKVPVHPTLAKVLATWKLSGWQRLFGRAPGSDDLIVPARRGGHRNVSWALTVFHEDLEVLGLRERRHYDSRRTFVSLALGDGASKDLLRWIIHTPGDVFDSYTSVGGAVRGGREAPAALVRGERGDGVETTSTPSEVHPSSPGESRMGAWVQARPGQAPYVRIRLMNVTYSVTLPDRIRSFL